MSLFAIFLSLALLMYFAYRGVSLLLLAPLLALLAVVLSGMGHEALGTYTQIFMQGMGGFAIKYFPIFLLGALFGKLMEDSGYALSIARGFIEHFGEKHAIVSIIFSCAILTYGGVSAFVVTFAVYPIAAALFRHVDIPKRLIPGAICVGALTFTMTALPGTPSIHNAIPIPYFETDAFAAPGLGLFAGLLMLGGGWWWLSGRLNQARICGEGYGHHFLNEPEPVQNMETPSFLLAIAPIVIVIGLNLVFTKAILPTLDNAYLEQARFGGISPKAVLGLWSIILALASACLFVILVNLRRWKNLIRTLNQGANGALLPIFNTASEVGYGTVIAGLAGFAIMKQYLIGLSPNNPLISEAIVVNVLAGITGSASGGLGIALGIMGESYFQLAQQAGITPEVMHRIATLASGGLDALPHNGAIITMLAICGLTHRQSYKDIFATAVAVPIAVLVIVITIATLFGSF